MLYTFLTNVVSCLAALFYPSYACYKLLSRRPCPEELLEKWLMYWAVLGSLFAAETVAYPLISWFPLYHTARMLFLIALAVNDGHLASFVYAGLLAPFLAENEEFIDSNLAALKPQVTDFARDLVNKVWKWIAATVAAEEAQPPPANQAPPPTMADPYSGPASAAWGLFRAYAPSAIAGLAAAWSNPTPPPPSAAALHGRTAAAAAPGPDHAALLARRAQLEAELAALPLPSSHANPLPPNPPRAAGSLTSYFASLPLGSSVSSAIATSAANVPLPAPSLTPYDFAPPPNPASQPPTPPGAGTDLRNRTPYDSEEERQRGYEKIGADEAASFIDTGGEQSPSASRASWWGWGGGGTPRGYERVKDE